MSRRTEQIGSTLHRALEEVVARGLNDPRIQGLISVTSVRVSADLKTARVLVSVYPHEKAAVSLHGLRSASGHIRREVSRRVVMRSVPVLEFALDESVRRYAQTLEAIARASEEAGEGDRGGEAGA